MRADAVFSGGGVKGIAFGGAVAAAEEAGYTDWARLGGTSAGAIAAMALAVGYDGKGLRAALEATDYRRLADYGGPFGRIGNYVRRHGLTRGRGLHQWIEGLLRDAPRPATTFGEIEGRLQVVGCDLAHSRIVVFPDDVGMYEDDSGRPLEPAEFPIADAVRISAGYPFFFPPVKLRDRATKRDGVLVDGGVASAFPVFLFDRAAPRHPTWGFRLHSGEGAERPASREIAGLDWPVDMAGAVLDTAMNAFDRHELLAFGDRTVSIPTGSVPTLSFALSRADQEFLYRSGYEAARAFFAAHPSGRNNFGEVPAGQT
ncbi:MAG TPA: patatin-like phospholipase family protein [Solirubrobacteraceae bacterium]|nr:patatin-like phospholipase family protein [Solirubrobacteraceae bacterium]